MEMIYRQTYQITPLHVDALGRVKPSILLYFAQEIAGEHCLQLGTDWDSLQKVNMFWALIRTKVEVTKLPTIGQTITVETWPMPATRTAFPRCTVGYDENGNECFKIIALWVLMDMENRSMVLPGKSGIDVPGVIRGTEPDAPRAIPAQNCARATPRTVGFGELDRNLHMNNTKYLDWAMDLLDLDFHRSHQIKEFTICYLSEARHGQKIDLSGNLSEEGIFQVDGHREKTDVSGEKERIFAAKLQF